MIVTLPPPLSASILPFAEFTLMGPPPVCRLTSDATLPYLYAAATGFSVNRAAYVIDANTASATLRIDPA